MSAQTVLQNILLETGIDLPGASIVMPEFAVRQTMAFVQATGEDLMRRAEWSRLAHSVTIGAVAEFELPMHFHRMASGGAVRIGAEDFESVRVVVSPTQWAFQQVSPSGQHYYHLSGGKLLFSPVLPAEGAVIFYVSRNWVVDKAQITDDSDTFQIPETLLIRGSIARWLRQKGLPFEDYQAEFEAALQAEIAADRGDE